MRKISGIGSRVTWPLVVLECGGKAFQAGSIDSGANKSHNFNKYQFMYTAVRNCR